MRLDTSVLLINETLRAATPIKSKNVNSWLPYAIAGAGLVVLVVAALICFCSCVRDCLSKVFCCCCPGKESSVTEEMRGEGFEEEKSSSNDSARNRDRQVPMRQHIATVAINQKYIGNLLQSGRRTPPPMAGTSTHMPTTAPPAAKQVARTAKIIGTILTNDPKKRRLR